MNNKDIFNKAWGIAKIAAFRHGGNKVDYFAEALKEAHKLAKTYCSIKRVNWLWDVVNGYIEITTPKKQVIRISNYFARTSNHWKLVSDISKNGTYLLTEDEIAILINLSNQKF